MSDYIIQLKNISKNFNEIVLFHDVDFVVKPKETVSICGASGSGKTTLTNIMGLLDTPTCGEVFWQCVDTRTLNVSQISILRSKIFGYIFQQCNLIPELNVLENILFPKRILSKIKKTDVEFAQKLLNHVGLSNFSKRDISTLSGGERQRVAVIRAFSNNPKIIIADEPTGNLDERSANIVMDMIMNLCQQYNSALLLITHNQQFAERMESMYLLNQSKLIGRHIN